MLENQELASVYPCLNEYTSPVKKAERDIIGREKLMNSIFAALMRPELCNVMLLGEPGAGKALTNDTLIPVVDRRCYVPIGKLVVGDKVFDENGYVTTVMGVYPQGKQRVYEVCFGDGTSILCNDEHLWNVREECDSHYGLSYKTMTLREIMDTDLDWYIPAGDALERPETALPFDPYAVGCDIVSANNDAWKRIPDCYMLGSIVQRRELLRGLLGMGITSGDNKIANRQFVTKHKRLMQDVCSLATSLGYRTLVTQSDNEYTVSFGLFDDLAITEIKDLGYETEMTCIYVDSKSHLFRAGKNHIVTHNTMLVQGTMAKDEKRKYLEVDLAKMIADIKTDVNEMATKLKTLFDETADYCKNEKQEVVLFIDEFHQIVQLSSAAVEALKPLLADSGTRGIRVIAATTYTEFRKYISPNQPLVERLQRINVPQPDKDVTVAILKGMAKRYGVENQFYNDHIFEMIYEFTNRYIPANSQPRKSILVLDAMVGWYRATGRKMNMKLLADVIYESEGVNVAFRVDAMSIKKELDAHVYAQDFATAVIEQRLQLCVADLNNKSKPMSSFLLTGSTGVGKTEVTKQLARILFDDDRSLIRFDMTEYANSDSLNQFRCELTSKVWERPYSIVLLDEIEKACAPVTRILLQVLDDGRLMDENNREVSFTNCYMVLTTNAGSEIYKTIAQYNSSDDGSGEFVAKYNKLIRHSISNTSGDNRFPPELLGRIDTIVPFQPLSEETMKKIVENKLRALKEEVRQKHNVDIRISKDVVRYLVEDKMDTDSDSGGARRVVNKLEEEVTTAVARFINMHPDISTIGVVVDGTMTADNKYQLQSAACIKIKKVMA